MKERCIVYRNFIICQTPKNSPEIRRRNAEYARNYRMRQKIRKTFFTSTGRWKPTNNMTQHDEKALRTRVKSTERVKRFRANMTPEIEAKYREKHRLRMASCRAKQRHDHAFRTAKRGSLVGFPLNNPPSYILPQKTDVIFFMGADGKIQTGKNFSEIVLGEGKPINTDIAHYSRPFGKYSSGQVVVIIDHYVKIKNAQSVGKTITPGYKSYLFAQAKAHPEHLDFWVEEILYWEKVQETKRRREEAEKETRELPRDGIIAFEDIPEERLEMLKREAEIELAENIFFRECKINGRSKSAERLLKGVIIEKYKLSLSRS